MNDIPDRDEATISYVDALGLVCRVRFGGTWDASLQVEVGHNRAALWLEEIGLVDPTLKRSHLAIIPPIHKVKLETALMEQFGRVHPQPKKAETPLITLYVEPHMLEPMEAKDQAGLVPLCCAMHWIMTRRGTQRVGLDDQTAWSRASIELQRHLMDRDFDVFGARGSNGVSEIIPKEKFALIKIRSPGDASDFLLSSPPSIDCSPYLGREIWEQHFNDKLYLPGTRGPAWTHLQLRKADILSRWPRAESGGAPDTKPGVSIEAALADHQDGQPVPLSLPRVRSKSKRRPPRACEKLDELAPILKKFGCHRGRHKKTLAHIARLIEKDLGLPEMANPLDAIRKRLKRYYERLDEKA